MRTAGEEPFCSASFLLSNCSLPPPGNTGVLIWFCRECCYYVNTYNGVTPQALPSALSEPAAEQLEFPQWFKKKRRLCFFVHSCKFKGKRLPHRDEFFWQFVLGEFYTLVSQIKSRIFSSVSSHHWRDKLRFHRPHLLCSSWLFVQSLFVQNCHFNASGFFNMQPLSPFGCGLGYLQPKTYLLASAIPQRNTLQTSSKRVTASNIHYKHFLKQRDLCFQY